MPNKKEESHKHGLYCLACGHVEYVEEGTTSCPVCHGALSLKPSPEEAKKFSVKVHDDRTKWTEKWNSAMCFVVLGSIGLIIGALFMVLSMQKVRNQIVGINFASFQFVVAALFLAAGLAAFAYGLYKVIVAHQAIKRANHEIELVAKLYGKSGAR